MNGLDLLDDLAAFLYGLHVEGDEGVVTLGESLPEGFLHTAGTYYGTDVKESSQDDHVEYLTVLHLGSLVHGVDLVDLDVGARGRVDDAVAVVDEYAAGLELGLELLERGLVEHDGDVVLAEDGRGDALVADDDGDVGRAAALLRAVGWHPGHFLVLHQSAVGEYLSHREDALSSES